MKESGETPQQEPWICAYPFLAAQVNPGGRVHACCANWIDEDPGCYGELKDRPLLEVWNSERARQFRRSIVDGSYRHCKLDRCALYQHPESDIRQYAGGKYGAVLEQFLRDETAPIEPVDLFLQYDPTCNLSCPSCRGEVHVAKGEERDIIAATHANVLNGQVRPRTITMCGTGEALASPYLREMLIHYEALGFAGCKVRLLTNGTVLDETLYRRLSAAPWIDQINVSIDAASKETFELVRRGGRWEALQRNLSFYSQLLAAGKIEVFATSFTLQARNFHEVYTFFDMCNGLGVTAVRVNILVPCGEFSAPERYREQAVHLPDHPDFAKLCVLLMDERFKSEPTAYYSGALEEIHRDPAEYARQWLAQQEQEAGPGAAPEALRATRLRVDAALAQVRKAARARRAARRWNDFGGAARRGLDRIFGSASQ